MTTERGSQAFRLVQQLNAGMSPPDHAGTIEFMARLLVPVYTEPGSDHRVPRHV